MTTLRNLRGFLAIAAWIGVALTISHWSAWLDVPNEHWAVRVLGGVSGALAFWAGHILAGECADAMRWRKHLARMERRS